MKKTTWLLFAFIGFCLTACEKPAKIEDPTIIPLEGFRLTDNLGNVTGEIGTTSDDWQFISWNQLTELEQSFLQFDDEVTMVNTRVTAITAPVAFPNPFQDKSYLYLQCDDSVKLKVAVVDSWGMVRRNMAVKMKGNKLIYFDFSNSKEFPSGMSLRYYYSFSANGQDHFKVGYGDIKICRTQGAYISCF